jgi:hypothetical protein
VAATFPSIKPTARSYTPGEFAQMQFVALNGATTSIRYGQSRFNSQLALTFGNITDSEANQILDHYNERMATFDNVTFSTNDGLAGASGGLEDYMSESNSNLRWRYAEPPQVQSIYPGISTVTCKFIGYLDGA